MDKELFFEKLFINSELADKICSDLNLTRREYSEYSMRFDEERKEEIVQIKRIRKLYHNKEASKDLDLIDFPDFNAFYKWYKNQYEKQGGKCYYCKTDERVIAALFEIKFNNRKRTNRGKHLEIERKDSINNKYSQGNCVLACYFCNNDKSDIFNEHEYLEYLKDRKSFLINQYEKLNDTK